MRIKSKGSVSIVARKFHQKQGVLDKKYMFDIDTFFVMTFSRKNRSRYKKIHLKMEKIHF